MIDHYDQDVPPEERHLSASLRDLLRYVRTRKSQKAFDAERQRILNCQPRPETLAKMKAAKK